MTEANQADVIEKLKKQKEEEEKRKKRGFLFWWWDSVDAGNAAKALASFFIFIVAPLYYFAFYNPDLLHAWFGSEIKGEVAAPVTVKVETTQWGGGIVFPVEGQDIEGKHASFDMVVLPPVYTWVRGSATQLAHSGQVMTDSEIAEKLFTPEIREGLGRSTEVMAVGLASQEGQLEEEEKRAEERAKTGAAWLANIVSPTTGIWMLNLGQFRSCPATQPGDTSWQRPVIVVGIRSQETGVKLEEALTNAIGGKSNLPSRDCYSQFTLTRYR